MTSALLDIITTPIDRALYFVEDYWFLALAALILIAGVIASAIVLIIASKKK